MRSGHVYRKLLVGLMLFAFLPQGLSAETREIRSILLKGIQATFSGEYDQAAKIFSTIERINPHHPSRPFYQSVVLFWKAGIDTSDTHHAKAIRLLLSETVELAEQMRAADETSVEALHYMGLAYTYLGRLEAHSGNLYKGGVLGEKGRRYLEQAIFHCGGPPDLQVDKTNLPSSCADIYFPYGAYAYFAGRLPRFLKWIDFLWFIPSGSTSEGLASLQYAARHSRLHRLGAESLLCGIYLNFEPDRLQEAYRLSRELIRRFPDNPYLELQHAHILLAVGHYELAAERARSIIRKVDQKLRNYILPAKQGALVTQAEAALQQGNQRSARKIIQELEDNPTFPENSFQSSLDLLKGMLADSLSRRKEAIGHYNRARQYKGTMRNRIVAKQAQRFLQKPFQISRPVVPEDG